MKNCFVLMPFDSSFDIVYSIIEKVISEENISCWRADKKKDLGLISQSIIRDIIISDILIVDISKLNPNVLYELGIAHVLNKPTIILSQELYTDSKLPFDITHMLTIPYKCPSNRSDVHARSLKKHLKRFIHAHTINHNPVSITLHAEGVHLTNYYGYNFLWGYEKTLKESMAASEAYVISSELYWERLDTLYYKEIFENRILHGRRKELVILPDNDDNRHRKEALMSKFSTSYPNLEDNLRILLIDDLISFYFIPTEITIYDATTPNIRGIMLEPMAFAGGDIENDREIAKAISTNDITARKYYNLKENSFDLVLPKITVEKMAGSFKRLWNSHCKKIEKENWLI